MNQKLIIIGGFLGAGKTTAIIKISRKLNRQGKKIGVITNDQTKNIVDTQYIKNKNLDVEEVSGSCFCCNYSGFKEKIEKFRDKNIIIAEPVGSCTDLMATIIKPTVSGQIKHMDVLPLSVIVDPKMMKSFMDKDKRLFSDGVYYIFEKQLEEADFIVINKIDLSDQAELDDIETFIKNKFKKVKIFRISSLNDIGIDQWLKALLTTGVNHLVKGKVCVDYNIYGSAEAEMGWLNATYTFISQQKNIDGNQWMSDFADELSEFICQNKGEIGHFKLLIRSEGKIGKLSRVSTSTGNTLDAVIDGNIGEGSLTLNLRASLDPILMLNEIDKVMNAYKKDNHITTSHHEIEAFRPGFPNPTYRL